MHERNVMLLAMSEAEKLAVGKLLYEAREAQMSWAEACQAHFDNGRGPGREDIATAMHLAVRYAQHAPRRWPVKVPNARDLPSWPARSAALTAARLNRHKLEQAARITARREELGQSVEYLASRFIEVSADEMARIEREGPDDDDDYRVIMQMLDIIEGELDAMEARDWLILTDGPARFASELPAPA